MSNSSEGNIGNKSDEECEKKVSPPNSIISNLWLFSSSPKPKEESDLNIRLKKGKLKHFKTQSLSSSPSNKVINNSSLPGSPNTSPKLRPKSSLNNLNGIWNNKASRAQPSVELSKPIASFDATQQKYQNKRLSVFSLSAKVESKNSNESGIEESNKGKQEVYKDSDSASISSKRISFYSNGWLPNNQTIVSDKEGQRSDKEIEKQVIYEENKTIKEEIKAKEDEKMEENKKRTWFGFSGSTGIKAREINDLIVNGKTRGSNNKGNNNPGDNNTEPAILEKREEIIGQEEVKSTPKDIKKVEKDEESSRNSWWGTLGFSSSSTTLNKTESSAQSLHTNEDVKVLPEGIKRSKSEEFQNNIVEESKEIKKIIVNNKQNQVAKDIPSAGVVQKTLNYMSPTWKYLFQSAETQKHLNNLTMIEGQGLIKAKGEEEDNNENIIQHEPSPPPLSIQNNEEQTPTYKEAVNQNNTLLKENIVLPILDEKDYIDKDSSDSPSLIKSLIDTIGYYSGYKTNAVNTNNELKINKVVIIGVHGWFPSKIYQKVIGEPTGTSEKFCDKMKIALKEYLSEEKGIQLNDDDIYTIPLVGEGKIESRLNKLYSLLLSNPDWMVALRNADHIFFVAHSQGTPVSVMLLARLIRDGLIDTIQQSTSLLAMAGITHGPFPFLKENFLIKYFEAEAARELFEFMEPKSKLVLKYYKSMEIILDHGVKVNAIASMVDQVVPLYSGIMHGFHHNNLYRALYIDHCNYNDDFLTNLIIFALNLRNFNIFDGDLLLHLSDLVAGSLYSGTPGHSTIYEEVRVYKSSLKWHFFKTNNEVKGITIKEVNAHHSLNPYYLPWIMRGILEDEQVKKHEKLNIQLNKLKQKFKDWNPTSKLLKELKFKLEPIKSKLLPSSSFILISKQGEELDG